MKKFRDVQEAAEDGEVLNDELTLELAETKLCERKLFLLRSRKESELDIMEKVIRKQARNNALKMEKQSQNYEMKF